MARVRMPRIILMDLVMPGMDGIEATRALRATYPGEGLTIIGISASAFDRERRRFLDAGIDAFIAKPFREQDLFDVLSHHARVAFETKEIQNTSPPSESAPTPTLEHASAQWREAFQQALVEGDVTGIRHLGNEAKVFDPALAAYLLERAALFDMVGLKALKEHV
jgi:CheY-like chemotaxis protein